MPGVKRAILGMLSAGGMPLFLTCTSNFLYMPLALSLSVGDCHIIEGWKLQKPNDLLFRVVIINLFVSDCLFHPGGDGMLISNCTGESKMVYISDWPRSPCSAVSISSIYSVQVSKDLWQRHLQRCHLSLSKKSHFLCHMTKCYSNRPIWIR